MKTSIKLIAFIAFLILAMFQTSCKSDDDSGDECEGVACPTDAPGLYVYIIDENQDPVALDAYEVINIATGEVLTTLIPPVIFEQYQQAGEYPLSTGPLEIGQERDVLFKGFINDIEVISSNYRVGRGCCYLGVVSGDVNLVLE
ncbi:hypothetical protein [Formosa maritima]|uniref:Uncharacterized protein n=1 Tax=Formosa maritima TaxID=2592046 RepID=A0A5D0G701_9FLAO|nr:hypothetical protein [Formosa maritima]TYA54786.1 hypothetical protein FVF61_08420 [Formosa maritima]